MNNHGQKFTMSILYSMNTNVKTSGKTVHMEKSSRQLLSV